jgi:hypothetical protein
VPYRVQVGGYSGDSGNLVIDFTSSALPAAPTLISPANGAQFSEGQNITLSWSATGNEHYVAIRQEPGSTWQDFGWLSGTSLNLGPQAPGYTQYRSNKRSPGHRGVGRGQVRTVVRSPAELPPPALFERY